MDDPAAFAAAANRLAGRPGLRDRLGAGGPRRAVEEFDHGVMAARSLAIYRRMLDAGRPAAADGRVPIPAAPLVRP